MLDIHHSSHRCLLESLQVRISLYILALAGPLIAFFSLSDELLLSTERSMGVTGLAVLFTSFMFTGQHKLDLFHALCVFHLVGLVGLSIKAPSRKKPSASEREPERKKVSNLLKKVSELLPSVLHYATILGFFVFLVYIFATAPHFGSLPECNADVKYVIFGIDIC
jgi:hypothetical protein